MLNESEKIKSTTYQLIEWLVLEKYDLIERVSHGIRMPAVLIKEAIEEYGGKIIMPPPSAFENIDVIFINGSYPKSWSVRFDLWNDSEGRSDLTLEFTLINAEEEFMRLEIDNLHVL